MNKVYAVRIDMYCMVMRGIHCECCGPEPDHELQGYVIHSLHLTKDDAEKIAKEIVFEVELQGIEYDSAKVYVAEMEVNQ